MTETKITPEKITKPIQLLAAWLAGLFSINSSFLVTATNMSPDSWESMALVIASIVNVPLFLLAVFLLQTKFRPELQEDSYYSTYLNQRTNEPINISKTEARIIEITKRLDSIEHENAIRSENEPTKNNLQNLRFGLNKYLTNREEIKSKLIEAGVISLSSFGGKEAPKSLKVSISKYLPQVTIDAVIALAKELNFNYYSIFDNHEQDTEEDVLIGSYGRNEFEIL